MLQNSDLWKQQMRFLFADNIASSCVPPVSQVFSSCNWISATAEIVVCRQSQVEGQQLHCWERLHVHRRLELHVLIMTDVEFDLAMSTWGFLCLALFW